MDSIRFLLNCVTAEQADQVEIFARRGWQTVIRWRAGRLEDTQCDYIQGIGVRTVQDGRLGFAYGNMPAESLVARALKVGRYGSPCGYRFPAPQAPTLVNVYDGIGQTNKTFQFATDHTDDLLNALGPNRYFCSLEWRSLYTETILLNSQGFQYNYQKTMHRLGSVVARPGESNIIESYSSCRATDLDLDHLMFLLDLPYVGNISSSTPVLCSSSALEKIGQSLIKSLEEYGGAIDPLLDVYDDGTLDWQISSSPCDDEGIPTRCTPVVRHGYLHTRLNDLRSAYSAGSLPTGNGHRTYNRLPCVNFSKVIVSSDKIEMDNPLDMLDNGLWIQEAHQIISPASGILVIHCPWALQVQKGKIRGRTGHLTLRVDLSGPNLLGSRTCIAFPSIGIETNYLYFRDAFCNF